MLIVSLSSWSSIVSDLLRVIIAKPIINQVKLYNYEFIPSDDYQMIRKNVLKPTLIIYGEQGTERYKFIGRLVIRGLNEKIPNPNLMQFIREESKKIGAEIAIIDKKRSNNAALQVFLYVYSV